MRRRKKRRLIAIISTSVFFAVMILLLLIIFDAFSCKKDVQRTNGIYAENFVLNVDERKVEFDYVFNIERAAIQREIDDIKKLGICVYRSIEEMYVEFDFNYQDDKLSYKLSFDDLFEADYDKKLKMHLYYIYADEKGKEQKRFSEDVFEFSMYELAKEIDHDYAYNIISIVENSIVRIDINFDIETQELSWDENAGFFAELMTMDNSNLQIVFRITGEKKFSDYARIYFNGKLSKEYVNEKTSLIYTTKIISVSKVEIQLDEEKYELLNQENELYIVSFSDDIMPDEYYIIIELKDNNILSEGALFTLNNQNVEYYLLQPGFYYIKLKDDGIRNINITLNVDNFEFTTDEPLCNVVVGRDEQYEDIAVTITAVEGSRLSRYVTVCINNVMYNVSTENFSFKSGTVTCFIPDPKVSKVEFNVDLKKYIIEYESDVYRVQMRNPDLLEIIIDINLKYGNFYSHDVALFINGQKVDSQYYVVIGDVITYTIEDPNWSNPF